MEKRYENGRRKFNTADRELILKKTNKKCARCGCGLDVGTMTVDHVFPVCKGGLDDEYNLLPLCDKCNEKKSNYVYWINDFYKYIDPQYQEFFECYFLRASRDYNNKTIIGVDEKAFEYIPQPTMKVAYQMVKRGVPRKKIDDLVEKNKAVVILRKAYPADAERIWDLLKDRHTVYDKVQDIEDIIDNGFIYILESKDKIHSCYLFEKYNYVMKGHDEYVQLLNVAEETGFQKRYVMTYAIVTGYESALDDAYQYLMWKMYFNKWIPIWFDDEPAENKNFLFLPHTFKGKQGYLMFPTAPVIYDALTSHCEDVIEEADKETLAKEMAGNRFIEEVEAKYLFEKYKNLRHEFISETESGYGKGICS